MNLNKENYQEVLQQFSELRMEIYQKETHQKNKSAVDMASLLGELDSPAGQAFSTKWEMELLALKARDKENVQTIEALTKEIDAEENSLIVKNAEAQKEIDRMEKQLSSEVASFDKEYQKKADEANKEIIDLQKQIEKQKQIIEDAKKQQAFLANKAIEKIDSEKKPYQTLIANNQLAIEKGREIKRNLQPWRENKGFGKQQTQRSEEKHKGSKLAEYQVGDSISFGSYWQTNSNDKEPIEWLVLEKEGNKALVISKYALDCQKYNTTCTSVTWETCTLRTWLNNSFFNNAFTDAERAMIQTTNVTADKNPEFSTHQGKATQDKIFLLSINQVEKYLLFKPCRATKYAKAQGASVYFSRKCWWWLRSPGYSSDSAADVNIYGSVNYRGLYVHFIDGCVRPALWINL